MDWGEDGTLKKLADILHRVFLKIAVSDNRSVCITLGSATNGKTESTDLYFKARIKTFANMAFLHQQLKQKSIEFFN